MRKLKSCGADTRCREKGDVWERGRARCVRLPRVHPKTMGLLEGFT